MLKQEKRKMFILQAPLETKEEERKLTIQKMKLLRIQHKRNKIRVQLFLYSRPEHVKKKCTKYQVLRAKKYMFLSLIFFYGQY